MFSQTAFGVDDVDNPNSEFFEEPAPPPLEAEPEYSYETGQWELPTALGDKDADLVFTPVDPCRLVDTREAAATGAFNGPITSGTTLEIDTDDNTTTQGGNPAGCGTYNNVAAIVVTITATGATGGGHFQVMPHQSPLPNASVLNYSIGRTVANTTIVPQNYSGLLPEIDLYVSRTTHVIVDVVGYLDPPAAAAPTTLTVTSSAYTLTGGAWSDTMFSPNCPSGYALTGGGYNQSGVSEDWWVWQSSPDTASNPATRWRVRGYNTSAGTCDVTVYGICARVP